MESKYTKIVKEHLRLCKEAMNYEYQSSEYYDRRKAEESILLDLLHDFQQLDSIFET